MSGAEPEDGAASGQEVSSPEGSGGYAAHAASPNTPASVPSLGSGRYRPPEDSPVAEVPAQPVVIADDDADAWGPWRAPAVASPDVASSEARAPHVASSEARAPAVASSEAQDVRDVKRPRRGIPTGSRVRVGAVPAPNESEEDLLKQVFLRELEVRRQEGEALGLRLRAEANEPLPLLSHFYGPPSPSEMYDSLALAFTDRSFLTRVALGGGSSQDLVGGATGITGKGRLDRPEEFAEETPYMPPRPPRFPEQEQQRPQQKLLIDQATITDNALEEWHAWLKLAQQGRSLREWGMISSDVVTAVQYLGEAPPRRPEEAAAAAGVSDFGRCPAVPQEGPQVHRLLRSSTQWVSRIVVGTIVCYGAGEARWGHGLGRAGGMEIFGGFDSHPSAETPGQKESEESYGDRYDGYMVADPESSSREAAACAAAYAYHACRGQLGLLFGGSIRSFGREPAGRRGRGGSYWGYSFLPRQGGVPLAPRGRHPGVWNTCVAAPGVSRSCCCSCGRKECRNNPRGHRYRFFGSSRIFGHSGWNSSGYSGDGAANSGGNRAEKPGKPGISYLPARPAGGEDAPGVGWFYGTLASWSTTSTCFTTTSTAAIEKLSCAALAKSSCTSPRADATGKGIYSPRAFGRSIFRAFGRHSFRNRNPIRRLRKRSGGSPSCYRKRQSGSVNSFDLCFLKEKKTCGEHVVHVWHEGFEWHGCGMKLGMNVSLICACFGSLGNLEAPQSLQALTCFPSLLSLPSSRVRTPAMFFDVVAATLFAGLLFAWSLLSGIAFWWCSLVLQFFRKWFRRRGLRTKRFSAKCRRKPSCFRMKLRNRWVRLETQRQLVVVRKEKVGCSALLDGMLRKCLLFWHVFLGMFGMFGMLVHVCERGDDEQPRPAKAEVSEHRLRAMHIGLPLPGVGTSAGEVDSSIGVTF